jgi:cation diffusion facilitator CzcD-associated flavoprotein CzcO
MADRPQFDAVVVGAGIGGIYAMHRLRNQGLSVLGVEAASDVGGVWYHNRYPGARVDVESYYYCFYDEQLYQDWTWSERYPAQPEILAYLNFAADRYRVRPHFRFNTQVIGALWEGDRYTITTDRGDTVSARFLLMATGQLSKPRTPDFPGLEDFRGRWVLTSHWPHDPVELADKRIGIFGTGSSGIQAIPELAKAARHLHVFQRTPNYTAPAHNRPLDQAKYAELAGRLDELWTETLQHPAGMMFPLPLGASTDFSPEERTRILERRWAEHGGHSMNTVFTDQGRVRAANNIVAEFIRTKVAQIVHDPDTAATLSPSAYPLGSRRLALDTGYYQAYNRDNVTLVDLRRTPVERITETGVQTSAQHIELDLIVFAIGFEAFTGSLDAAGIRNAEHRGPSDYWTRGPRTYLGLMTRGFPNLFLLTGPGGPSVLANLVTGNVQQIEFTAALLAHMAERDHRTVEPTEQAQNNWTAHVNEVAEPLIRRQVDNFMVHVNDDGTRFFIPYAGGLPRYAAACDEVAANGYSGFAFDLADRAPAPRPSTA